MMKLHTVSLSLLTLVVFTSGLLVTETVAAQSRERMYQEPMDDTTPSRERRYQEPMDDTTPSRERMYRGPNDDDEGLGSAQVEFDRIITPEYRRRGMRVERMSNGNLRLRLPSEVLFAYDSANISREFAPTMRQVARIMERRPRLRANIIGHTDSQGSDNYNLDLSMRRAESVASTLSAEGVRGNRLRTEGRGEQEPVASNATTEGRRLNRRVEIILYRSRGDRPNRMRP